MSPQLDILLVRLWTLDTERIRTSICAAGLSVRITRVDFPAALHAALSWGTFDAVVYDPETPAIPYELLLAAVRDRAITSPIIMLSSSQDVGQQIAMQLKALRN